MRKDEKRVKGCFLKKKKSFDLNEKMIHDTTLSASDSFFLPLPLFFLSFFSSYSKERIT